LDKSDTQYYLSFILAANAVVLLALRRWEGLRDYLLRMTFCGLCFLPLVIKLMMQLQEVSALPNVSSHSSSSIDSIKILFWSLTRYVLPLMDQAWNSLLRSWLLRLGLPLILIWVLVRYREFLQPSRIALWLASMIMVIFFVGISIRLGTAFVLIYHTAALFLPIILTVTAIIEIAGNRKVMHIIGSILLVAYGLAIYETYKPMAKGGDWRRVASHIMQTEKPGEPILVFRSEFVLPFRVYYTGKNDVIPIPKEPNLQKYDPYSQALKDEESIKDIIAHAKGDSARFWLITVPNSPLRGVDFHPELLDDFVHKYLDIIADEKFFGSRVRLLIPKKEQG